MVAEQRSNLLRKSRSPSFFKKNLTKKSAVHYRNSPLRGAVLWEVQSIERCSPLRGAVQWEVQSVEGSVWRKHFTGTVQWEGQSTERSSPLRGTVLWEGQSIERRSPLRGSVWWEAGGFKEENFAKNLKTKGTKKFNSTKRYHSKFYLKTASTKPKICLKKNL